MKLRMRGNSLRLRLTKSEVQRLATRRGPVEDAVRFGPNAAFSYSIARGGVPALRADFDGSAVRVVAPSEILDAWATSEQVGFEAEQAIGDGQVLRILVEKDWTCLTSRPGEEDVDTFPNPNTSC